MKKFIMLAIFIVVSLPAYSNIYSDIHITGWVPPESRFYNGFKYKHYYHRQFSNIFSIVYIKNIAGKDELWGNAKKYCIDGKWHYQHSIEEGHETLTVVYRYDAYRDQIDHHACSR